MARRDVQSDHSGNIVCMLYQKKMADLLNVTFANL